MSRFHYGGIGAHVWRSCPASDNNVGTWKLNLAKSKYISGPAPYEGKLKIEPQTNGLKFTIHGTEGKPVHFEFSPRFAARGEAERKPTKVELELDTKGRITGIPDSDFSSPAELGQVLASNAECQKCLVKQVFRYAMGRLETPADRAVIDKGFDDFKRSQFKFQQLIISLVTSKAFRETVRYE